MTFAMTAAPSTSPMTPPEMSSGRALTLTASECLHGAGLPGRAYRRPTGHAFDDAADPLRRYLSGLVDELCTCADPTDLSACTDGQTSRQGLQSLRGWRSSADILYVADTNDRLVCDVS